MKAAVTAREVAEALTALRDDAQAAHLMRFFKTGPGQYGEGDRFLGLKVPVTRAVVRQARQAVALPEISTLLHSPWHEVRLAGFLLLVEEMKTVLPKRSDTPQRSSAKAERRRELAEFYLAHATRANNWDLVDLSCEYILGPYLRLDCNADIAPLRRLASSENLWEQRIAVVATLDFIRNGIFAPTLELADRLMNHPHDLIHKAVGWTLREVGKRDRDVLTDYLERNCTRMPRTALRYAIEHYPAHERAAWLKRR
ncbi:MAG: DNA alkylation repair protein [Bacteroidales bacterium]|nr:DNA alkylation repair protein [Bacteroidales bacterium]